MIEENLPYPILKTCRVDPSGHIYGELADGGSFSFSQPTFCLLYGSELLKTVLDMHVSHHDVAKQMMRLGGSFVKALGSALGKADNENVEKIQSTWPEIYDRYRQMAVSKQANDEASS